MGNGTARRYWDARPLGDLAEVHNPERRHAFNKIQIHLPRLVTGPADAQCVVIETLTMIDRLENMSDSMGL